ncbi:YcaO-like family protein [Acuticoccus sp. I52.16.1]|uniref:YcaO-like family protein n=1 Tax=Acuticoccus sp. I52.16.1 TaxID=2928472 RepID=UPI001FD125FC|nr:YcaO-like family protein [Acuticoccus sp. I52.16.1]UOM34128.1 YcaO-like family protein [Acuticoccus sp. I52.16.1]
MHGWGVSAGRGLTLEDAQMGAIFEAIERASLLAQRPHDPRAVPVAPGTRTPAPGNAYWHLSAAQLAEAGATMHECGADSDLFVDSAALPAVDLVTGARFPVPASAAFVDEDLRRGWPPVMGTSTGTAAHTRFDAATRAGLLECIERDAVAIWWYNRLPARRMSQAAMTAALPAPLAGWIAGRRRRTWCLLAETDLPVPAVVALSAAPDGRRPAIGAAARLDTAAAVTAAVLEMLQGEVGLAHMRAAQTGASPPAPPPLLAWSEATDAFAAPELQGEGGAPLPSVTTWDDLLAALERRRIDVAVVDLTTDEFAIPVAKVVSRTLRDWQPRFAPGRLYDVPVAFGHPRLAEGDLNPVPFVI